MADKDNRQWFENNDNEMKRRQKSRTGGKKHGSKDPKTPADPSRKQRSAKKTNTPSAGRPPKPSSAKPSSNKQSAPKPPAPKASAPKAPAPNAETKPKKSPQKQQVPQKKDKVQSKPSKPQPAVPLKGSAEDKIKAKDKKPDQNAVPDQIRKRSSRRRALVNSGLAVVLVLAGLLVLVFIVHHLFDYFAVKPNLEFVTNGSIEHTIGSRAMIVRDENVVGTEHGGDFVTQAAEGSRVARGQAIAMVVPADMQTVVENLRNTQSQISDVQQELIAEGAAEGADVIYSDIDQSLAPIINMMRLDAIDGNLSSLSSYASSISVLMSQRESELAELDFDDERLRTLRSDERGYESQLQNRASVINAPEPGIVSFKLDGLETVLNYDVLLSADAGTIRDYINDAVGIIPSTLTVQAGDNVARIASNNDQYIACFLNESDAPITAFDVGSHHTVIVGSEGLSIGKCVVQRVTQTSNGNYLVVFSTTRYVEDLLDIRSVDIEVVITETRGMRVPVSSLVNPDYSRGVASLYVNDQGFCSELGVLITDYDREFAIITPMGDSSAPNLQTVYITNPESVEPGDQVS